MTHAAKAQKRREDNGLAAFTDALLEGESNEEREDQSPLESTVARVVQALRPEPPPEYLCRRIRQRVVTEWPNRQPHRLIAGLLRPARWAWAAAAATIIVAVLAAILTPAGSGEITGTVTGDVGIVAAAAAALLVGCLIAGWLASRRR